jgi:predicted metal-dependent peptidase
MDSTLRTAKLKLSQARTRLLYKKPWYGHIAINLNWVASPMAWLREEARTMGVRFIANKGAECIYYPPFVVKLSVEQIFGVLVHELEHLVRLHPTRIENRHPLLWNIAVDMVVNGKKSNPQVCYEDGSKRIYPLPVDNLLWYKEDWQDGLSSEVVFDRLIKESPAGGGGCIYIPLDSHELWRGNTASADEARQVMKSLTDLATQSVGNEPGHLSEAIEQLSKPKVCWQKILHEVIGRHVGNKRMTFNRLPRRSEDPFGIKGVSRHACGTLNVIIDTSGSVSQTALQKFFTEIELLSHKYRINVLQWDHGFQGFGRYRRNDWKTYEVKGRGGTDMDEPVKWLEKSGEIANMQIMFTDGEVGKWPDERDFPMAFIIVNSREVDRPKWGTTVFINSERS